MHWLEQLGYLVTCIGKKREQALPLYIKTYIATKQVQIFQRLPHNLKSLRWQNIRFDQVMKRETRLTEFTGLLDKNLRENGWSCTKSGMT